MEAPMSAELEDAIALAADRHRGQRDKSGAPYIMHPLRVMLRLGADATPEERMAAILHDVVEDCGVTFADLARLGYAQTVIDAVDCLTKRPEEEADYMAAIRRAARNPIARRVKMADLQDNLDISRISSPTEKDFSRLERYRGALNFLESLQV
jgi:(p)ppGpp synthase/HD superfamily hydrolase